MSDFTSINQSQNRNSNHSHFPDPDRRATELLARQTITHPPGCPSIGGSGVPGWPRAGGRPHRGGRGAAVRGGGRPPTHAPTTPSTTFWPLCYRPSLCFSRMGGSCGKWCGIFWLISTCCKAGIRKNPIRGTGQEALLTGTHSRFWCLCSCFLRLHKVYVNQMLFILVKYYAPGKCPQLNRTLTPNRQPAQVYTHPQREGEVIGTT